MHRLLLKPLISLFLKKSEASKDEIDNLMRLMTKRIYQGSWKTADKYPLLAIMDEVRPWEIILANLAEQKHHLVSLDLSLHGTVLFLTQQALDERKTSIMLIIQAKETSHLEIMTVVLKKPYQFEALV